MVSLELFDNNNIAVIRNRVRTSLRNGSLDALNGGAKAKDNNSNIDAKKYHGKKRRRLISAGKLCMFIVLISLTAAVYFGVMRHRGRFVSSSLSTNSTSTTAEAKPEPKDTSEAEAKLEPKKVKEKKPYSPSSPQKVDWSQCTKNPPVQKPRITYAMKKVNPLWLPAYPTSIPSQPYSDLIKMLTGIDNGAKTYYRTSPSLKRCHYVNSNANIHSVTCEIVHPIIPANRPNPAQQSQVFGKAILIALRNPITAFPSHHQSKAEAYHGQTGQVDEDSWAKFRDQYVGNGGEASHLFAEFKNFIAEWRKMEPYKVAEYLPFESWTDEIKGPKLIQQLAKTLKKEGFPVLYDPDKENDRRDLGCIWHQLIYKPMKEDEKIRKGWYEPEYTKEQYAMMANELEKFVDEIKDKKRPGDEQLIEILNGYSAVIRKKLEKLDWI